MDGVSISRYSLLVGITLSVLILGMSSSILPSANATFLTPVEIIDSTGDGSNAIDGSGSVATDLSGNVFVAGFLSDNVFKITPAGVITEIIDSTGDGSNALDGPDTVATDLSGNVFVSGLFSDNVFKITPAGVITEIIDITGDGSNDLNGPHGVATDSSGNVFVAAGTSDNVFKITPAGVITQIIDSTGDGSNTLNLLTNVATDLSGNVFVIGFFSDNAFKITPAGVITEIIDINGDGSNLFNGASGVATDSSGNVFVAASTSDNAFKIPVEVSTPPETKFRLLGHDNVNHEILTIDTITGVATLLGPTGFDSGSSGLATTRADGKVTAIGTFPKGTHFGVLMDDGSPPDGGKDFVVVVNPSSGFATKVVEVDMGTGAVGVAFGEDNLFYVTDGTANKLYTVDLVTGLKTFKGDFKDSVTTDPVKVVNNLQFDPDSSKFIALAIASPQSVYSIATDGTATKLAELDPTVEDACAIARAPDTGEWFSVGQESNRLFQVNIDTGAVTDVGSLGDVSSGKICGLVFEEVEFKPETKFRLLGHDNVNHEIHTIDTVTGAATLLGPTGFDSGSSGLATTRADGKVTAIGTFPKGTHFGVLMDDGSPPDGGKDFVVVVNPSSGFATKVVEVDMGTGAVGVAFGEDNLFYVTDGTANKLYTVDLVTGLKTFKGDFKDSVTTDPVKVVNNLQFDPDSSKFIALAIASPQSVYSIDTDGTATKLAELSPTVEDACAISRAPDTGEWFSVKQSTNELFKINIATGAVTIVGSLGPVSSGIICGLVFEEVIFVSSKTSGSTGHEPPTIGKSLDGVRQVVASGMSVDGQTWTVTQGYHQEFELLQMLTSPHTISNVIHCSKGVQYCNYIAVGFMGLTDDFNNPVMTVSASKDHLGTWTIDWYDPNDFISDPDDAAPVDIVFVPQIIDNKLLGTSFTIDFKNKDTGQLKMGIQVRDSYLGVRNFYFNEGVEFIDADAYLAVESAYDNPIEVESLCFGQNNPDRNSCQFAKIKDWATENAEETLRQMMGNQYEYDD